MDDESKHKKTAFAREQRKVRQHEKEAKQFLRDQTLIGKGVIAGACLVKTLVCALPQTPIERPRHADTRAELPDRPITTKVIPYSAAMIHGDAWMVETMVREVSDTHLDWFWEQRLLRGLGKDMFPNCKEISESVAAYRAVAGYIASAYPDIDLQVPKTAVVVCVAEGSSPRTASLFGTLTQQEIHAVDPLIHPRFHSIVYLSSLSDFVPTRGDGGVCRGNGSVCRGDDVFESGNACTDSDTNSSGTSSGVDSICNSSESQPPFARRLTCHPCTIEKFCSWLKDSSEVPVIHFSDESKKQTCSMVELPLVIIVAVHSHVMLEDYVPQIRLHYFHSRVILVAIPCCVDQRLAPASTRHLPHSSLAPILQFSDMGIHSDDRVVRVWDLPPVSELTSLSQQVLNISLRTGIDTSKSNRTKISDAYAHLRTQ